MTKKDRKFIPIEGKNNQKIIYSKKICNKNELDKLYYFNIYTPSLKNQNVPNDLTSIKHPFYCIYNPRLIKCNPFKMLSTLLNKVKNVHKNIINLFLFSSSWIRSMALKWFSKAIARYVPVTFFILSLE